MDFRKVKALRDDIELMRIISERMIDVKENILLYFIKKIN